MEYGECGVEIGLSEGMEEAAGGGERNVGLQSVGWEERDDGGEQFGGQVEKCAAGHGNKPRSCYVTSSKRRQVVK